MPHKALIVLLVHVLYGGLIGRGGGGEEIICGVSRLTSYQVLVVDVRIVGLKFAPSGGALLSTPRLGSSISIRFPPPLPPPPIFLFLFLFPSPCRPLQGMDRLLAMLMKIYFIHPEDTLVGARGRVSSRRANPMPPPPMLLLRGSSTSQGPDDDSQEVASGDGSAANTGEGVEGGRLGHGRKNSRRWVSAPSSASSGRGAEEGEVLGEKVFRIFAGLFEGFRLRDLYLPERGGVMVCTEVSRLELWWFCSVAVPLVTHAAGGCLRFWCLLVRRCGDLGANGMRLCTFFLENLTQACSIEYAWNCK